ncbi:MAG: putative rane protein [Gemmatimonadetes bacterium]|nr:putative rane protein [Gemmatimonadota bacterium]
MHTWTLIGIAIVIVGFLLRLNPLLVVTVAGIATGLAGGLGITATVEALGKSFTENRYVAIVWLVLPVIGLLERSGLKERTQELVGRVKAATPGRVLLAYLGIRQVTAALGLTSLGGHAQMVRPLVAPMAEAAGNREGRLPAPLLERIRAFAAATDNVGLFFGEDIFIAIGSILLIKGFLEQNGILVEPVNLAVWAIPTALAAFLVHGTRLLLLDGRLRRDASIVASSAEPSTVEGTEVEG